VRGWWVVGGCVGGLVPREAPAGVGRAATWRICHVSIDDWFVPFMKPTQHTTHQQLARGIA
jgi:hypothetical protein